MKKLLCAVLAFVIMLSCGAFALTKSELYTAAVDSFMNYLNDDESISLDSLYNNFASLGSYEWSMQYMLYTDILRCIQKGSYARVSTYLTVLRSNADFCAFLEEQSGQSKVGSVDELEAYVNAKKALGQGDSAAALQYFMSCPNFMDSTFQILSIENSFLQEKYEKASALFEEGRYAEAEALFKELDGYEDSAELSETCAFMISVLAIPEATEEEAAEEIIPEETKTETAETVEPVDDTEYVSGDYKYKKLNNGKIEITKYTGNAAELSVPGEFDGFEVYSIGDYAFNGCTSIKQINLPESLAMIGRAAFQGCESLKQLSLPDGLMAIGDYAFNLCISLTRITLPGSLVSMSSYSFGQCHSLTQITIPDSVSEINGNPFAWCENLTKIIVSKEHPYLAVIDGVLFHKLDKSLICCPMALNITAYTVPDGILSIGQEAFLGCQSLIQINLPESLTSIDVHAFDNCLSLSKITLPDSLISIGNYAFAQCHSLSKITLPDNMVSIGDHAFEYCHFLAEINIPDSVSKIGVNPFINCDKLKKINISKEQSYFSVHNGVLFDKVNKKLICYPLSLTATAYTIPDGIVSIGSYAFYCCDSLAQITLPDSLTSIGYWAFGACDSLVQITLPDSLTYIGGFAFDSCDSLVQITLPDSLTYIDVCAFRDCISLAQIALPNSLTYIANNAFYGCDSLCLMVYTGSYAAQYAKENDLNYEYIDALDWLNN